MTLRQQQEYLVCNLTFLFLPYYCVHSPIATNRITKPNAAYSPANAKTADMISHACRLIFINITLSNRIVKPNNRYTRRPASHDFLFYSAPDKVYALTATNRIAMRFAVRSATPLSYHADSSTVPKAEFEVAHCQRRNLKRHIAIRRFAIARNAPTIPKAEFGAAHCRPPLRSCFPASS